MNNNNINTLTFENHDTYIYYVDEIKKSFQIPKFIFFAVGLSQGKEIENALNSIITNVRN